MGHRALSFTNSPENGRAGRDDLANILHDLAQHRLRQAEARITRRQPALATAFAADAGRLQQVAEGLRAESMLYLQGRRAGAKQST